MQNLTGNKGVDYAFEVIGRPQTINQAYNMTRKTGTTIVVGEINEGFEELKSGKNARGAVRF